MPSGMHLATGVDVLGDDGKMRYGRVVDVADSGLFVDMLCPNRRREHIPFGSVFWPNKLQQYELVRACTAQSTPVPVEVLVPETSFGPWIWLAGEAVSYLRKKLCVACDGIDVHWQRKDSGMPCTEFVPMERLRWPVEEALTMRRMACRRTASGSGVDSPTNDADPNDLIGPQTFVKHTVQLDDEFRLFCSEEAEMLIKRLNEYNWYPLHCAVTVVEQVDGRLGYIYQSCNAQGSSWWAEQLLAVLRFQKELVSMFKVPDDVPPTNAGIALSVELWLEVFSHLETVAQMDLRAVCTAWNTMMETPVLRSCILIGDGSVFKERFADFFWVARVYKRLQCGTRHIVIDGKNWHVRVCDLMQLGDLIHYVAQKRAGIRLRSILLSRCEPSLHISWGVDPTHTDECVLCQPDPAKNIRDETYSYYPLEEFFALCSSLLCDAVHLANCIVRVLYAPQLEPGCRRHWGFPIAMEIPAARLSQGRDIRCALWGALDAALPARTEEELRRLCDGLKWIGEWEMYGKYICKTLCATQSADPRSSAQFRGKRWCVDGLEGLQLEKLSRITLSFLVELYAEVSGQDDIVRAVLAH